MHRYREQQKHYIESGVLGSIDGSKGTNEGGGEKKKEESEKTELRDRPADRKR